MGISFLIIVKLILPQILAEHDPIFVVILGSLGILDDITVSQAAIVDQLKKNRFSIIAKRAFPTGNDRWLRPYCLNGQYLNFSLCRRRFTSFTPFC